VAQIQCYEKVSPNVIRYHLRLVSHQDTVRKMNPHRPRNGVGCSPFQSSKR